MLRTTLASLSLALILAGCTTQSARDTGTPIDLHNTQCAVTGDPVGDSKLTVTYQGKIYHFCCDGCPQDFQKDPEKYVKAINADPAKYGIKSGS